jgi:hypothetical protein
MYSISKLIHKTFFHDKASRQHYVNIIGTNRKTSALNKLSRMIDSGSFDNRMCYSLLGSGVSNQDISTALSQTKIEKYQRKFHAHQPVLIALFDIIPVENRQSNVHSIYINHMTRIALFKDIASWSWSEQVNRVKECINKHERSFHYANNLSARENYFGELVGYEYRPTFELCFTFTSFGELVNRPATTPEGL